MGVKWEPFLVSLERHVRANPWIEPVEGPGDPAWRAGPPAGDADIASLEAAFGVPFPPSYVGFLRACNGLSMSSHPIGRLRPSREVRWFRGENREWIQAYTDPVGREAEKDPPDDDYYGYSDSARLYFRPSHFRHTVQISDEGDSSVYLLNPQVVWPSGEWEAWFLANWNPDVIRYRSFAELMWEQYGAVAGLDEEAFGLQREQGPPTVYRDPPGKPQRRGGPLKPPKAPRPLERIARDVRDGDYPTLRKAIDELARLKTPEAIELLASLLRTHPVEEVRGHAALALAKSRHPHAVPILIDALEDRYSPTVNTVINALAETGDARAAEPLLRLLEKRPTFLVETTAAALAKLNEPRAAEVLGRILRSNETRSYRGEENAAGLLSEFGDEGLRVLLDALENGERHARLRAIRAAYHFDAAAVGPVLRSLASDTDTAVREAVAQALMVIPLVPAVKRR